MELVEGIDKCPFWQAVMEEYGPEIAQNYLATLGETAMSDMHAQHEVMGVQKSEAKTEVKEDIVTTEIVHEVMGVETIALPAAHATLPRLQVASIKQDESGVSTEELPEVVPVQLDRDIREVLFERSEVMPRVAELEAVEPCVQPETPQVERAPTVKVVPKLELPTLAVPAEANVEVAHVEQIEVENVESIETTLEVLSADEAGPSVLLPEKIVAPEAPVTMVELLMEPFPDTSVERDVEEPIPELDVQPTLLFSIQLERLVTETVEPARQEAVETLIAEVYEILVQANVEPESSEVNTEQMMDTLEITQELERVVTELLQELGVVEPSPEQIERLIVFIRAEVQPSKLKVATEEAIDTGMHEHLQGLLATGAKRLQRISIIQALTRLILAVPLASTD